MTNTRPSPPADTPLEPQEGNIAKSETPPAFHKPDSVSSLHDYCGIGIPGDPADFTVGGEDAKLVGGEVIDARKRVGTLAEVRRYIALARINLAEAAGWADTLGCELEAQSATIARLREALRFEFCLVESMLLSGQLAMRFGAKAKHEAARAAIGEG